MYGIVFTNLMACVSKSYWYGLGCPEGQMLPEDLEQRVLRFSRIVLPSLSQLRLTVMNIENRVELENYCGAKFAPIVAATSKLESNVCELTQQLVRPRTGATKIYVVLAV